MTSGWLCLQAMWRGPKPSPGLVSPSAGLTRARPRRRRLAQAWIGLLRLDVPSDPFGFAPAARPNDVGLVRDRGQMSASSQYQMSRLYPSMAATLSAFDITHQTGELHALVHVAYGAGGSTRPFEVFRFVQSRPASRSFRAAAPGRGHYLACSISVWARRPKGRRVLTTRAQFVLVIVDRWPSRL